MVLPSPATNVEELLFFVEGLPAFEVEPLACLLALDFLLALAYAC
ncbi:MULTISPECIES: hypothetical protein [unclassified Lactococcus]|nr:MULTISPECIES: hypothetical protein [unclassified Lactococcus]